MDRFNTKYKMKNTLFLVAIAAIFEACAGSPESSFKFTGAPGEVRLITLDPGHFHAALIQKTANPSIDSVVAVYAPEGGEVESHLAMIESFNSRAEQPTNWTESVYKGADFMDRMLAEKRGNVVVLSGNNGKKIDYIEKSLGAGLNVLADKPWVIDTAGFTRLKVAVDDAQRRGVLIYDIMTERYDIFNMIQKELMSSPELFGQLQKGTPERPAVEVMSIHAFYKEVAGKPLVRPAWFYDVKQQGEGIVDITTHLIDLVHWKCFDTTVLNYKTDIEMVSATHFPTLLTPSDFRRSTTMEQYPSYLEPYLRDSTLAVNANGTINYRVRGVNVEMKVEWVFETPKGSGDIARAVIHGTKASLMILQDKEQGYRPQLYAQAAEGVTTVEFDAALARAVAALQMRFPNVTTVKEGVKTRIVIPESYNNGHEAHFAAVAQKYFDYLVTQKVPEWEMANTMVKYYITTKALSMAE